MPEAEADWVLDTPDRCTFNRSPEADPIFWAAADGGGAAIKLNGVLVPLDRAGEMAFAAGGASVAVEALGDEADWRANADLLFRLEEGLTVGYRGFWTCPG